MLVMVDVPNRCFDVGGDYGWRAAAAGGPISAAIRFAAAQLCGCRQCDRRSQGGVL